MHLQNFDVERSVKRLRHPLGEGSQQIDAETHVARLDDHCGFCRLLDLRLVGCAQACGSDYVNLAPLCRECSKGDARDRRGEIDNPISLEQQRRRIPCSA